MEGEVCSLKPISEIDNKPSKFYTQLLEFTNNDREITNFFYAISKQDLIAAKFDKKDLNSQGEPDLDIFIKKLDIKDLFSTKQHITNAAKQLNAIDRHGNTVYYDNPNSIIDDVIDFNELQEDLKAKIKWSEEGYYIEVDIINSKNFNTNFSLETGKYLYLSLMDKLSDKGLNVSLSPLTKKTVNPVNMYSTLSKLKELRSGIKGINIGIASFLIDVFENDTAMVRLKSIFGEDLPLVLSQVSGFKYENSIDISESQERMIKNMFKRMAKTLLTTLDKQYMDTVKEKARAEVQSNDSYEGIPMSEVQLTLKDLYERFHIDNDVIDSLSGKIDKVSQVAQRLLLIRITLYNERRVKGMLKNKGIEDKYKRLQGRIDRAKYLESIVSLIQEIQKEVKSRNSGWKSLIRQLLKHPDSLLAINALSKRIMGTLNFAKDLEGILLDLRNLESKDNDDLFADRSLIKDIKELGRQLTEEVRDMQDMAEEKMYDCVKAFLLIYWGEDSDEMRKLRGNTRTLDDIINQATTDINFFDRFIYAVNTCNDEMMALVADAVKRAHDRRDNKIKPILRTIRQLDADLRTAGARPSFIYEMDENGNPKRILSDIDYDQYEKDRKAFEEQLKNDDSLEDDEKKQKLSEWLAERNQKYEYEYTDVLDGRPKKLTFSAPNKRYYGKLDVKDALGGEDSAKYKYYKYMMDIKATMIANIEATSNSTLYDVIEIGKSFAEGFGEDPLSIFKSLKRKFGDELKLREDDTDYGMLMVDNDIKLSHVNARGEVINTLPLFYTHKIKDRSRVSSDFTKGIVAYLGTSLNYLEMNEIVDSLELTREWMLRYRQSALRSGSQVVTDIKRLGGKVYGTVARKAGVDTSLGGLADDFYERAVYGKTRKDEGYLWGTRVKIDKAVDFLTGYTSTAGLTVNFLGALANLYVGKIQMLIESGMGLGGEFFNVKDLLFADCRYFQKIGGVLNECMSNNKTSWLGLLMEEFDVLDDFYERIRETGFYNTPLSKIIGNTSLFVLYGLGEHLLHALGMLAVLHNIKVLDDKGNEARLVDAFDTESEKGHVKIKKGWTTLGGLKITGDFTTKEGEEIDELFLNKVKHRIAYVNKTMHGAFGGIDKGMIHRYAVGRLVMNFRQWMPAHYQRRFRGRHWDSDLNEYREGFYVSTFKFLRDCIKDLSKARLQIGARWSELSDMEKYNLKRTFGELTLFAIVSGLLALLGPAKDHKGNWAKRHLIYQLMRIRMEISASTPISYTGINTGFIKNITTMLNSPVAAVSQVDKLTKLLRITDIFSTIEGGKYDGENRYIHNLEIVLPYYPLLVKAINMGDDNALFAIFE